MEQKEPLNILLADDDRDDRFFFEKALETLKISANLETVIDGQKLMDYLSENSDHLPDVLFLDLNMPRKSGSECLIEIKQNEKFKQIPVVIYSTSLREEVANVLYQNGANYYLHKCDFTLLPKCIQMALDLLAENPIQPSRDKFIIEIQN